LDCKDIGIRKFEVVTKNQFLLILLHRDDEFLILQNPFQNYIFGKSFSIKFKRIENLILSDPPCTDGNTSPIHNSTLDSFA